LIVALLLIYVLQCAWFVETQSITFDESIHTAVSQDVWRNHRFMQWIETPPLGHLLLGLPIHGDAFQMEIRNPAGWLMVTSLTPGPKQFIRGPCAVSIALGVIVGILVWCGVRQLFSPGAAAFALALFAFSPQLIAHFAVATVDGIGVLTVFAVVLQLVRWRTAPSWRNTMLLGLCLGLALLAKFYAPPIVLLATLVMLVTPVRGPEEQGKTNFAWYPSLWSWKQAFIALCIAALVVWSGYFFHAGAAQFHDGCLAGSIAVL
jgi:4-amino-4-deoxy-L-arabinose transferase-like glycosyltransferase